MDGKEVVVIPLPIIYLFILQAPESLRDLQYSTKSDVWSFGIVGKWLWYKSTLETQYSSAYIKWIKFQFMKLSAETNLTLTLIRSKLQLKSSRNQKKDKFISNTHPPCRNEAYHPSLPSNVPEVLRELMLSCWQPDPDNRPSMEQLCNRLNSSFPDE